MSNDRQTCADQILKAIDYGKLPADEIEARLQQMIRDELSGADQSDSGRIRVELCNSLLWQLYTHGEVRGLGADDDAMKARIEKGYARRRRRKWLMTRAMISLTTAMVLLVGLTAAGMIQPLRWFTGRSTEDEQQYIIEGHEVSSLPVSVAIANHVPNATRPRSLQATNDPDALIAFLGFDPGLPRTAAGVYSVSYYRATITEENLTIISFGYMKEGQEEGNTEFKLYAYYYPDANDAYLSFEQSEEGELISLCGTQIYRYRNVDRYSYTWTRDAQVWSLTTKEPPEAAEAFLEDFLRQRAGAPVQAQNEGTRSLQTVDSAELISFLGFDPRFPASLNTTYIPTRYNAYIDSQAIKIIAQYGQVDNTITDAPLVSIRMTLFFSVEDARIPFEQDAEGEYVMIGGVSVYRYTNTWTSNYLWLEGQTIVQFLTSMPFDEADPLVEEIIKSRNGT